MEYPKYTLEDFEILIQEQINPITLNQADSDVASVYQKLFDGLDVSLLKLMCTQIKWSLVGHQSDALILAMRSYADQIIGLVPLWAELSDSISKQAKDLSQTISEMSQAYPAKNPDMIRQLSQQLLTNIQAFEQFSQGKLNTVMNQQGTLMNFIIGTLRPAISNRAQWTEPLLEQCLSNDRCINGTDASIYNGKTIFSFVTATLSQSQDILKQVEQEWSMEEIMFTLSGQAKIWEIINKIATQLKNSLEEFQYTPPYYDNFKGGESMYTENKKNEGSEQQLQTVINVTKAVVNAGKDVPKYKLAQQMLRLMNGEAEILQELPTLKQPLSLLATDHPNDATLIGATSETSVTDSKGLLGLTKENIIDIKTYVKKALGLKTTTADLTQELGYDDQSPFSKDHPEFSPSKFVLFYQPFHTHAQGWNALETDIIQQGNAIQVYGTTFVSHADFVLEQIKGMKIYTAVEDVTLTDPDDKQIQSGLLKILDRWKAETCRHLATTTDILNRLTAYQNQLVNTLQPSAVSMSKRLNHLDIEKESADLKKEIDILQAEIDAKQREYDKDCGLACTGAAGLIGGPLVIVTWAVTGGIYGAKAEKARKARNELQKKLADKKALYNNLNQVAASVHHATSGIEDLNLAITNAVIGLKTLNAVWGLVNDYIDSAKESLESINKKSDLMDFTFELESAQASWKEVPSIAASLLDLFKQAEHVVCMDEQFMVDNFEEKTYTSDKEVWSDKYAELSRVFINPQSTYMPILQQKASELRRDARSIYDAVQNTLPRTVLVPGKLILHASNPEILLPLEQKIKDNPQDKEATDFFNRKIEDLKNRADQFARKLTDVETIITSNTEILKKNVRTDLTHTGFYAQLNNEYKRFEKVIQSHTEVLISRFILPMQELETKIKKLDSEIEQKIDPENLIKGFKEFLPSSAEISDMLTEGAAAPGALKMKELQLIYNTALKGLDVLAGTIKLCKQVEEQSRLASELGQLQTQFEKAYRGHQELLDNQAELEELKALHSIFTFFADEGANEAALIRQININLINDLGVTPVAYADYHKLLSDWVQKYM